MLLTDDDVLIVESLQFVLADAFEVLMAKSREAAIKLLRTDPRPIPLALVEQGLPPNRHTPDADLKSLLDFCSIDAGQIEVFGVAHSNASARAPLAYLPERLAPPYFLRGEEYLRTSAKLYATPYDSDAVVAMCAALELDPHALLRLVRTYSKGMA